MVSYLVRHDGVELIVLVVLVIPDGVVEQQAASLTTVGTVQASRRNLQRS